MIGYFSLLPDARHLYDQGQLLSTICVLSECLSTGILYDFPAICSLLTPQPDTPAFYTPPDT